MTSFNKHRKDFEARGIDYDLYACLKYNPQSFTVGDIEKVLAVWEGQRDRDYWRWVLLLEDGRYVFLEGGCDYTGWDCQSAAYSTFVNSALEACEQVYGETKSESKRKQLLKISEALKAQITSGKAQTWRETMDGEFGN